MYVDAGRSARCAVGYDNESTARTELEASGGKMASGGLVRPQHGRVIAGVCAGVANRFGWSPWLVRILVIVSCVLPGPQILAYLVLWLLMPSAKRA